MDKCMIYNINTIKFIMSDFFTIPVIIAIFIAILAFLLILEPENLTQNQF